MKKEGWIWIILIATLIVLGVLGIYSNQDVNLSPVCDLDLSCASSVKDKCASCCVNKGNLIENSIREFDSRVRDVCLIKKDIAVANCVEECLE